ncbi:MAG: hypothetical protein LBT48_05740 [Prevotellaceae bacterium]|jgi:hypothetical protein|nr:hypothetical protein [Prevotellaceae bacterium]
MNKEIDIGLSIRRTLQNNGQSISWLARQVNCDRCNLRKQLFKAQLDVNLLLRISIILKTDFLPNILLSFTNLSPENNNNEVILYLVLW